MRLVEILAREVDEWPERTYCYTQDRNGKVYPWVEEPYFCGGGWEYSGESEEFLDYSSDAHVYFFERTSDYDTAIVTKDMWLAEKNKAWWQWVTEPEAEAEWKEGVDLPPVGVECEREFDSPLKWEVVKILAHAELLERSVAIFQLGEEFGYSSADKFRKIDTKRQERENYIDRIYGVMCKADRNRNRSDMAEALYDAGLRFVEE